MSKPGIVRRALAGTWRVLDGFRKAMHLIVMLTLALVLLAGLVGDRPRMPKFAALVLAPEGRLVDQLSGDPLERALAKAQGSPVQETLLKDLIDALEAAADDQRVKAVLLRLERMTGSLTNLSKYQELGRAIDAFKASGKPVIALGDGFTRDQYYLASRADEIYVNPNGFVVIEGYGRYRMFFKEAVDKLKIDYNVFRAGEYKSAEEPFLRDDMSPESKEASSAVLSAIWDAYQQDVTAARELGSEALQAYADRAPELLAEVNGDFARLALDYGLVDGIKTRGEMRARMIEVVGADPEDKNTFPTVGHDSYLSIVNDKRAPDKATDKVAVVVAVGTILDGDQPPGTIGGNSTAKLIRKAREDDNVKALVLRVDSGGGSQFASDVILEELQQFQKTDRPLVATMGGVAASGGYWISMSADEIWANPSTVTGSIGVTAAIPTFQRSLDRLGLHADGVATTRLAGQLRVDRELGPDVRSIAQQAVAQTYQLFISGVAENRGKTPEEVDAMARGRIWSGQDAQALGLVDKLGDLDAAIQSAAKLAGLEEGAYRIEHVEKELEFAERLALQLAQVWAPLARVLAPPLQLPAGVQGVLDRLAEPALALESFNDPRGLYSYCFCTDF
jgi:protease-4